MRENALTLRQPPRGVCRGFSRVLSILLSVTVPAATMPGPTPQTPLPAGWISGEGGSGHVARARRERTFLPALRGRHALSRFVVEQGKGLKSITDLNGNVLSVTAGGITASNPAVAGSAKTVAFTRDSQGRITKITDPAGNAMTYAYDGNGDLQTYSDRESNTTSFTYHPAFPHHLEDIKDPLGRTPIRNEYYDDGRIKSHTDAFGKTITYDHNLSARQEQVTDRNGAVQIGRAHV